VTFGATFTVTAALVFGSAGATVFADGSGAAGETGADGIDGVGAGGVLK